MLEFGWQAQGIDFYLGVFLGFNVGWFVMLSLLFMVGVYKSR